MKQQPSPSMLMTDIAVVALLVAFAASAFIFRDSLGIFVFAALGLAVFVQLFRMAFLRGRKDRLKKLWDAFKDAFWGIG